MENREIKEANIESNKNENSAIEDLGRTMLTCANAPGKECSNDVASLLPSLTLNKLAETDKATLNNIYRNASAGDIPEGETKGLSIALPGTKAGEIISNIDDLIW